MRVLITGGTGFIGTALVKRLLVAGNHISILTRNKGKVPKGIETLESISQISEDEKIDVIINLAGAPIAKRWSKRYKQELLDSRINTTQNILSLIQKIKNKPSLLMSASAIGYYGAQGETVVDESTLPHDGFTHQLCKQWETEALKAENEGVRVCFIRLGVVLGKQGGALKQMLPAFKVGVGGCLGSGKQYFSWVHIEDVVAAIDFIINHSDESGAYNLSSPNPITNKVFTKYLGQYLNRPTVFSVPQLVIKLLYGEMGQSLLLDSIRVIPSRLEAKGFEFQYPKIEQALEDIL